MMNRFGIECVDETLRKLRNKPNVPFGGAIVILGGDFRQTMPILEGAVKSELLDLSLKWSPLWKHFAENMFTLTENIRLNPDEREFSEFLIAVGNGDTNEADESFVNLPDQCYTDEDLVRHVYADLIDGLLAPEAIAEYLRGRCILGVLCW
ncbi:DNA helicase PIF1 [Aphelenchoides avenae]|nr:DNA helicase PIF1 [Aphelenchus avenae]